MAAFDPSLPSAQVIDLSVAASTLRRVNTRAGSWAKLRNAGWALTEIAEITYATWVCDAWPMQGAVVGITQRPDGTAVLVSKPPAGPDAEVIYPNLELAVRAGLNLAYALTTNSLSVPLTKLADKLAEEAEQSWLVPR